MPELTAGQCGPDVLVADDQHVEALADHDRDQRRDRPREDAGQATVT